jgi:outer membrane protein TolC
LLGEKITIIEQQLELLGKRIEYSRKRSWTSYITIEIDPVKLLQNIFGGGDVQRDKLAIADLQVKTAQLESALAELERQKEEEKINLEDKVLRLVLDYEAVSRKVELVRSQLETYSQQQEILRIRYRLGQGETAEFLESQVRGDGLRGQLVELESLQQEKVRELGQVTGLEEKNEPLVREGTIKSFVGG